MRADRNGVARSERMSLVATRGSIVTAQHKHMRLCPGASTEPPLGFEGQLEDIGLTERAAHLSKDGFEFRRLRHLRVQAGLPSRLEKLLLLIEDRPEAVTGAAAEAQLLRDCIGQMREIDATGVVQIPKVVQIAGLGALGVGQCKDLFGGNLVDGIHLDTASFREIEGINAVPPLKARFSLKGCRASSERNQPSA